jgi:hypothetical protein
MALSNAELRLKADVRPLKAYVREELPPTSILRQVVEAEEDKVDAQIFLKKKVPLFTSLLRREKILKKKRLDGEKMKGVAKWVKKLEAELNDPNQGKKQGGCECLSVKSC